MGRNARVTSISLDKIYSLMASNDGSTEGVTFRFIPDAYEVQAALKLQPDRKHFAGVPVFQVGLQFAHKPPFIFLWHEAKSLYIRDMENRLARIKCIFLSFFLSFLNPDAYPGRRPHCQDEKGHSPPAVFQQG